MAPIRYTYSVLRYVHDAGTGERLNVGVALYAPGIPFFGVRVESEPKRMADAFPGFDAGQYGQVMRELEAAVSGEAARLGNSNNERTPRPGDVVEVMRRFWPDRGLCFQLGPPLVGVSESPVEALEALFSRMVGGR